MAPKRWTVETVTTKNHRGEDDYSLGAASGVVVDFYCLPDGYPEAVVSEAQQIDLWVCDAFAHQEVGSDSDT